MAKRQATVGKDGGPSPGKLSRLLMAEANTNPGPLLVSLPLQSSLAYD